MRDDRVGAGSAEVVGRKALEHLVRQAVRGREREFQSFGVGDAGAVEVGSLDLLLFCQGLDLRRSAVNERDPDVQ